MSNTRKTLFKLLRYTCLTFVIAFGFITMIASDGGGGAEGGGGGAEDDSWLYPFRVETDIIVSDIDGDGRNDILTLSMLQESSTSKKEGHLKVYRQTSQGNFSSPSDYIVGEYPWQLAVGDINDDDLPDLLTTEPDSGGAWVLLQDPDNIGQFLSAQIINTGGSPYYTAIDDLNNDGELEIAISDNSKNSNRIVIFYHDPENQETLLPSADFVLPDASSYIATGDLNRDGLTELITWVGHLESNLTTTQGELAVSFQQPDGTLGPVITLAPQTGLNVDNLTMDDYNGDGANDIFIFYTPFSSDYKSKLTVVLQGSQPGTFGNPVDTSLAGISGIDDAVVADLNGDGRPDVAVAGFFPVGSPSTVESRVNIFTQSGGGVFSLAASYNMPISVSRIGAGDIDGDGLNDLVVLGEEDECMVLIQSHYNKGTFNSPKSL